MSRTLYTVVSTLILVAGAAGLDAQPDRPVVTMTVSTLDGQTAQVTAPDSEVATMTLKDGHEYGFEPAIQDSKPWMRTTVRVFKMGSPNEPLGEVDVKTGAPAVIVKTTPEFKIAIPKIGPPISSASSS